MAILFPADKTIRLTLKGGAVYYFVEDSFVGKGPHYFVVLNKQPIADDGLVFVCAVTLDIDAVTRVERMGYARETLIDVTSADYALFTRPTLFDCNNIVVQPINVLVEKMEAGELLVKDRVSETVLVKLRQGVIASRHVSEKIKKLIR